MPLQPVFLTTPIAHRGLHDLTAHRPENSLSAVRAAVAAGYGVEIDVQLSADGRPMVIHDPTLERTAEARGRVEDFTAQQLAQIPLRHSAGDTVAPLAEALAIISGQVPLLLEIKDTSGDLGAGVGPLEAAVAREIADYDGPLAVMSFNPHSVAAMAQLAPHVPRGLVTCDFVNVTFLEAPPARLAELALAPDYDRVGACFVSHHWKDLDNPLLAGLRAKGACILTWTIKSRKQAAEASGRADNITFEHFLPDTA